MELCGRKKVAVIVIFWVTFSKNCGNLITDEGNVTFESKTK